MEELFVIKRNQRKESISFDKVLRRIQNLCKDLAIDGTVVSQKVCSQIYPGVTTKQLDELAAQICASLGTVSPDYDTLASRIIVSNHQKNTLDSFQEVCKILHARELISEELWSIVSEPTLIKAINEAIDYQRDYLFTYFGFKTLEKSYLLRDDQAVVERPQHMFMRVALGLHGSLSMSSVAKALECYRELSLHYYIHATPTLFNSGTPRSQLASCFLLSMKDDTISGVYDTLKDCAMISKYSGGIGLHIHNIRGFGSQIKGTNGTSNGIVPMLRVFNDTARYVDQGGGKRNGSFAIYLEPWHSDVFEFLQLKKNHGDEKARARDLFYALWVSDLFMRRVKEKGVWSLMSPDACPGLSDVWGGEFDARYTEYEKKGMFVRQVPAQSLWMQILKSQIETGTPYLLFKDKCNAKSNQQNLGTIKSSNLCTEIIEYSDANETAVCNLASINLSGLVKDCQPDLLVGKVIVIHTRPDCAYCLLAKGWLRRVGGGKFEEKIMVTEADRLAWKERQEAAGMPATFPQVWIDGEYVGGYTELLERTRPTIDYDRLEFVARKLTRNLDRTIDINFYPTKETRRSNLSHRPIGIGVQGFADMLIKLRIPFSSEEARAVNRKIFCCIYHSALWESCNMAKERAFVADSSSSTASSTATMNEYDKKVQCTTHPGSYSSFAGSPMSNGRFQFNLWDQEPEPGMYEDWDELREEIMTYGLRNSLLVAPMPTASTSQILGNCECFEPITSNIYLRRTMAGEFVVVNHYLLRDLIDLQLWSGDVKDEILMRNGSVQTLDIPGELKELYKTVWELPPKALIDMAADRSIYICQSQSLNLFMEDPDVKRLSNMHFYSWGKGLKTGIYYLRTQPATKAQMFSIDAEKMGCLTCSA